MIRENVSLHTSINNSAFSSFFYAIFAWALLHAWGFQHGASPMLHAFIAFVGVGPVAASFRRYRLYWRAITMSPGPDQRRSRVAFNIPNASWGLLLLAIGYAFGHLILVGFVLPLAVFSMGLTFVPWSKLPL
jgi:hypothetical protein